MASHPGVGVSQRRRPWVGPAAVGLLCFAGFFKATPALAWFPIDLTLVGAAAVALLILGRLSRESGRTRFPAWVPPVVAVVVLPGFFPSSLNPYAASARLGIVLVGLTILGAVLLIGTAERQRAWVWVQVVVGLGLVALGAVQPEAVGRFALQGENTIAAAQASGGAAVVLLTLLLTGALRRPWQIAAAFAAVALVTSTLLATGSRGPVISAALSVLIAALATRRRGRIFRTALAFGAVYAGAQVLQHATGAGAQRLQLALSGQIDNTASHAPLWDAALAQIPSHPFGIGWGNFYDYLVPGLQGLEGYRIYPHNVVLEAALEGGWIAGVAVVVFLAVGITRLILATTTPYPAALLAVAVFYTLSAMVSGSIGDNRAMFAAVAVGFVVARPPRGSSEVRGDLDEADTAVSTLA